LQALPDGGLAVRVSLPAATADAGGQESASPAR